MDAKVIKDSVIDGYGKIANRHNKGVFSKLFSCCDTTQMVEAVSHKLGYSALDIQAVPEGANLGIGCGNPLAMSKIKAGDTVLDLGSGAGFDCFLAAASVGSQGKVIGVDITPEMIQIATRNAQKGGYSNVVFLEGDIEQLPVADHSVDLVISNCVLNLSTNKAKVFQEVFRVLKSGGELTISDIVLLEDLPDFIKNSVEGYVACIAGAERVENYFTYAEAAGFVNMKVETKTNFPLELLMTDPIAQKIVREFQLTEFQISNIANSITSVTLSGLKR